MSDTTTTRIDVTVYHPNGDVMESHTVQPHGVPDMIRHFELLGYKIDVETVTTVVTRTPYMPCPYDYAHTQLVCGNPHCRAS
jgi:hypothetical protein